MLLRKGDFVQSLLIKRTKWKIHPGRIGCLVPREERLSRVEEQLQEKETKIQEKDARIRELELQLEKYKKNE